MTDSLRGASAITIVFCISVTFFVASQPVHAESAEGRRIEEVVVTARKRAENLQQVPMAVTAFTEKTIDQAGIERVQDFIQNRQRGGELKKWWSPQNGGNPRYQTLQFQFRLLMRNSLMTLT